jgi:hypothetical protein
MTMQSFATTFSVDQPPKQVFELTYRYQDIHYSKQRLVEVIPDRNVVWLVLDSYLSFAEDKTEWNGTKVIFEIARKGNKTEVRFTHEGLVLDYQCFDKCSSAWGFYINDSLKSLITTGKGDPNKREN